MGRAASAVKAGDIHQMALFSWLAVWAEDVAQLTICYKKEEKVKSFIFCV